jgi:hypothetical protein
MTITPFQWSSSAGRAAADPQPSDRLAWDDVPPGYGQHPHEAALEGTAHRCRDTLAVDLPDGRGDDHPFEDGQGLSVGGHGLGRQVAAAVVGHRTGLGTTEAPGQGRHPVVEAASSVSMSSPISCQGPVMAVAGCPRRSGRRSGRLWRRPAEEEYDHG